MGSIILVNSLMTYLLETLSHILNPKQSQNQMMDQLPSLSEPNSTKLLETQPRMSSLSTMPHGADIARSLPQSGKNSVPPSRITPTSLLLNSMPLPTRPTELKLEDTQL